MDNIQNAKSEAEEVKVAMLENENKTEELKDVNQKPEKPQCTFQRKKCKESAVNQKMVYLRANKGLIATVLISAALIFAVVVAMLATTDGHSHSAHNSKHIVHVHNVTEMP
ncbi:hypothetical protein G5714_006138 [Onychostoma macrolepis]|uniref:Uncharacterized protein n=1 Tax=Onychostoma macrolepis TaxID=369639 RepID=A0A7J6D2Z9_9TELE|nr:hypothetical protein G5714_006138 [Onychostoma macrolepis]